MKEIVVSGLPFKVDDEDFERVKGKGWYLSNGRAYHWLGWAESMERFILNHDGRELVVDHIDRDMTNNQRSNLRLVTQSENMLNTKLRSDNTTGHKGISYHWQTEKWTFNLWFKKKRYSGRYYKTKEEAVSERDKLRLSLGIVHV